MSTSNVVRVMNAVETMLEKVELINRLSNAVTRTYSSMTSDCIESVSFYGNTYSVHLKGSEADRRSFTFGLLKQLKIDKFKRNLDSPSRLEYSFQLESLDRWSEKHLIYDLQIENYPCNFRTECSKTCYAVYDDGRRVAIVKKGTVDQPSFDTTVTQLCVEVDNL